MSSARKGNDKRVREKKPQLTKQPVENHDDARVTMSGPSMRPMPTPRPHPTPEQLKAQEHVAARSRQLTRQMVDTIHIRHNWATKPRKMQRIQRTLSRDTALRNALFRSYKGPVAFVSLDPRDQLRVVKSVRTDMQTTARNITAVTAAQSLTPNPTDPLNQYNQANPNNLANQQQAAWQATVLAQDNQVAQTIQTEDNLQSSIATQEEIDAESAHTLQLTDTDTNDIVAYNSENYGTTPSPSPETGSSNTEQADNPEIKEGEKVLEHAGEEKALRSYMDGDKEGMKAGMKGEAMHEGEKEMVEHTALKVGLSMAKAASAA